MSLTKTLFQALSAATVLISMSSGASANDVITEAQIKNEDAPLGELILDDSRPFLPQLQAWYLLQFQHFLPEGKYVGVVEWTQSRCVVEVSKVELKQTYRISVSRPGISTSRWGDEIEFGAGTSVDWYGGEDFPSDHYSKRVVLYSTSEDSQGSINVVKNSKTGSVNEIYGSAGKRQWRCESLTRVVAQ